VAIEGTVDLNDLAALRALGVPAIQIPNNKGKQE
jgi:hypothetical protein